MDANAIVDAIMIAIVDAIMMRMRMWMRLKDQRIRIQTAAARYFLRRKLRGTDRSQTVQK